MLLKPHWDLIQYCNNWFFNNDKKRFLWCLAKGIFSTLLVYVSLASLAYLVNEIQISLKVVGATYGLLTDSQFRFVLLLYFCVSWLAAYFQYSFFKDSYQLWATHSIESSSTFIKQARRLPNSKFGRLNRFCIDQVESMLNSGNRARAVGAFGHYVRIMYLEALKVILFGVGLLLVAPKFGALIVVCFVLTMPWIVGANRRASDYSVAAELQQRRSATERRISLRRNVVDPRDSLKNPETQTFFNLVTQNYLQSKANTYYSTIANTIALVLVLVFIVLSVINQNNSIAYWVAVILLGKLFATSVMQLSSSWVLMSRQAPLASTLRFTLEEFVNPSRVAKEVNADDLLDGLDFGSQLLWLYQSKVLPAAEDLDALLYLADSLSFNNEMDSVVITQDNAGNYNDDWLFSEDIPISLEALNNIAVNYGLNHLRRVISKDPKIPMVALKAAKIQYQFALSVHLGKRIYLSSNLFWVFDVSLFSTVSKNTGAQIILYFSHHAMESRWPNKGEIVLKYDHVLKKSSLSIGLSRENIEELHSYDLTVNDYE